MHTLYLVFAVAGCTIVAIQVVLQLIGFSGDSDLGDGHADIDHGGADAGHEHGTEGHGNLFFGMLSFKALCAFAGLFGLTGLVLEGSSLSGGVRLLFSIGAGVAGMLAVARLMVGLSQLDSSGTVNIRNAVGHTGTVYIRIPEKNTGFGKVTVEVQGRLLELRAATEGEELRSGMRVTVVGMAGDETLKVEKV